MGVLPRSPSLDFPSGLVALVADMSILYPAITRKNGITITGYDPAPFFCDLEGVQHKAAEHLRKRKPYVERT